jgi:hypothetical protein
MNNMLVKSKVMTCDVIPVKVTARAVVNHFSVILHSQIFVTIIASVELELIERLDIQLIN